MRRSLLALAAAIAAIGLFAGGLGWLLDPVRPPAAASRGERLYYAYCVDCHGADGRGSWRALLFLRRPGDLADPDRIRAYTDEYLFTIIRQGGDVLGRPGMPAFRQLPDEDVRALVDFVRSLPARSSKGASTAPSEPPPEQDGAGKAGAANRGNLDARLGLLLDPHQHQVVAALAHSHPDLVPGGQASGVEQGGVGHDGHRLHGRHAERSEGFVTDEEKVGSGPGDDLATDLVSRGAQDRAPEARREGRQQRREERDDDDASAAGAGGRRTRARAVPSP